ncbi:3-dehydroquinate synthase [Granulicella sp. 5B5]|uniref:3-dehydroquinate synthase n=1 Tax=Granulicella sp. 5B5 TaxID=1617967 RepID=UPI0015F74AF5|nr:3-dehydroquinate synthase [Granulicella sp. 5B5]QMV17998.1 3-dehydroquinate synthase [Granulicella sp. 5B5]
MSTTQKIAVTTPSASYTIEIGTGLLPFVGSRIDALLNGALTSGKQRAFVITSPEIWHLHGPTLLSGLPSEPVILEVPAGEQHKRLSTIERLLEELAQHGADRDSLLIAFGGGVLGDMTGYLAASYMRGIRYVQVPTTLLAQVDSSVGGKTGVNLAAGKNLVGAFYHPIAVYADIDTLATLPPAELRAGLQESVKAGIIRDRALFDFMEANAAAILSGDTAALTRVVADSVQMKADVVHADEREGGLRMILNLGHTLGHAIEAATGYKQLLHGEAIAWGMLAATAIAKRRGLVTVDEHDHIERVIITYGPLKPFTADPAELVTLTSKDKKARSGTRNFVLPKGIGDAVVVKDVAVEELTTTAERMMAMVARQAAA